MALILTNHTSPRLMSLQKSVQFVRNLMLFVHKNPFFPHISVFKLIQSTICTGCKNSLKLRMIWFRAPTRMLSAGCASLLGGICIFRVSKTTQNFYYCVSRAYSPEISRISIVSIKACSVFPPCTMKSGCMKWYKSSREDK